MTGQHRKGVTVTFDANLPAVRKYIDDAVAIAVNQAAHAIRAVREYCDYLDRAVARCLERHGDYPCTPCIERARIAKDIRALLPEIREAAEEVDMGTRVTRDREYPGGTDSGN